MKIEKLPSGVSALILQHGTRAPLVRNTQMVDAADMVVAIWDHQSTGTAFTVRYARRQGKPVRVYILKP